MIAGGPKVRLASVTLVLGVGVAGCGGRAATTRPAVPAACASTSPARAPASSWSLTRRELAPPGVRAIRLCRYSGSNDHPPLTLIRSVLLSAPTLVRDLVREFDELPSQRGAIACPLDDDSKIVAHLAYPDGHAVTVSLGLRGCEIVTNGSVSRIALGVGGLFGPRLVTKLEGLTA